MRRIVILGHTGFIGSALYTHLVAQGHEVTGFASRTMDLRQRERLQALDGVVDRETVVIFASAITRDKGDSLQTLIDNTAMAGHLGEFLESHPPGMCVCLSSDAVYPMQETALTEESPVAPGGTFYAIGKYTAECVLRRSADAKRIPLLVLRPTAVFGAGDTHNSYGPNAFLRAILRDRSVRLFGEGEERRDHLYIDDFVRVVTRLVRQEATGTFNLATGRSHAFADVVAVLREIVPFEFAVTRLPRRGPVTHRRFDIGRLTGEVPDFRFTDLDAALRRTFQDLSASMSGSA